MPIALPKTRAEAVERLTMATARLIAALIWGFIGVSAVVFLLLGTAAMATGGFLLLRAAARLVWGV